MIVKHIVPALLLSLNCFQCTRVGQTMSDIERKSWKLVSAPPMANVGTKQLNIMTLGHRGLYDDFATIWAVQFLADKNLKAAATADEVYAALHSITRHKPHLESLYMLSCFVLAMDYKRPELCEKISIEGLQAFPESWRIPMMQGFIASYELNDPLKAAGFYHIAASRPTSPPYVAHLAEKLTKKGFSSGEDLNETADMLKNVPGGTRILELMRERLQGDQSKPIGEGPK
jgi:hypothetical protein